MLLRTTAPVFVGVGVGAYVHDVVYGGQKVNRSSRALYAALATFVEYKFVLGNSTQPVGALHRRVAERWLWCVRKNGGLYSKLAQGVASMNHVLPAEYLEVLSVIQDQAPTVGPDEVEEVLRTEFGKSSKELFAHFEPHAIASASVAQVHQAITHDGRKVAVKIQKPQIARQIDADLFMYSTMGWFLETAFGLPITWGIPYTCKQLRQETDFRIEARNSTRAAVEMCPEVADKVYIPEVLPELSGRRVLTCEWIDGVKITNVEAIRKMGFDTKDIMDTITRFFAYQLFVSGHLHADPHPGNIMLRPKPGSPSKYSVVVIDHGLYCDEPEVFREGYARLFRAIVMGDADTLKDVATSWGIRDHELFASFQLFRPYKGGNNSKQGGGKPVTASKVSRREFLELQKDVKERIRKMLADSSLVPPELTLVGRNLNLIRSLNKELGSPVNRPRIMSQYANRGVHASSSSASSQPALWWWWSDFSFNMRLLGIELAFQGAETWRALKRKVTGVDTGGFEEFLETQVAQNVEQTMGFNPLKGGDVG